VDQTLREASAAFFAAAEYEGSICPCCLRFGRYYKRPLNSTMARSLMWLVQFQRKHKCEWVSVPNLAPKWLTRTNQLPTCRYWGLIESQGSTTPKVKCSGVWRATDLGRDFVDCKFEISDACIEYKTEVLQWSENYVSIKEALGVHYDYQEVMATCLLREPRRIKK
jgi:hypothetical protein